MTEWPKNPQLRVGTALLPSGPVNVFNEKVAVADAINRAIDIKTQYDTTHPTTDPGPPPPQVAIGEPISPGAPPDIDASKYVTVIPKAMRRR